MHPSFATYTFGQTLVTIFEVALLVLWIWVSIRVIVDVFESEDLSGWSKAGWMLLIVLVPLLGVAAYLIARGNVMALHSAKDKAELRNEPRRTLTSAPSDMAALEQLKERKLISDEDYRRGKQKAFE